MAYARATADPSWVAAQLSLSRFDYEPIVCMMLQAPARVAELVDLLDSKTARTKYSALKILKILSQRSPEVVYPWADLFIRLLTAPNTILRWGSAQILGNLAAVDRDGVIEQALDPLLAPICGHEMITAANVILAGAKVARARPALSDRITDEILKVEHAVYQRPECRNVAIGHALLALDLFFPQISGRDNVLDFARRQLRNSRPATRRKAEAFMGKWSSAESPRVPPRRRP